MLSLLITAFGTVFVAEIVGDKLMYTTGALATFLGAGIRKWISEPGSAKDRPLFCSWPAAIVGSVLSSGNPDDQNTDVLES